MVVIVKSLVATTYKNKESAAYSTNLFCAIRSSSELRAAKIVLFLFLVYTDWFGWSTSWYYGLVGLYWVGMGCEMKFGLRPNLISHPNPTQPTQPPVTPSSLTSTPLHPQVHHVARASRSQKPTQPGLISSIQPSITTIKSQYKWRKNIAIRSSGYVNYSCAKLHYE